MYTTRDLRHKDTPISLHSTSCRLSCHHFSLRTLSLLTRVDLIRMRHKCTKRWQNKVYNPSPDLTSPSLLAMHPRRDRLQHWGTGMLHWVRTRPGHEKSMPIDVMRICSMRQRFYIGVHSHYTPARKITANVNSIKISGNAHSSTGYYGASSCC